MGQKYTLTAILRCVAAHLHAVLSRATAVWSYQIDETAMNHARLLPKRIGFKMKSRERIEDSNGRRVRR